MSDLVEVAAGLLFRGNRVLLVRRAWNKHPAWSKMWSAPGGRLEPGEDAATAVVRELKEEIGLVVQPTETINRAVYPLPFPYAVTTLLVVGYDGHPTINEESLAVGWWTLEEVAMLPTIHGLLLDLRKLAEIVR